MSAEKTADFLRCRGKQHVEFVGDPESEQNADETLPSVLQPLIFCRPSVAAGRRFSGRLNCIDGLRRLTGSDECSAHDDETEGNATLVTRLACRLDRNLLILHHIT